MFHKLQLDSASFSMCGATITRQLMGREYVTIFMFADLADGYVVAINYLNPACGLLTLNLGTCASYLVL